MPGYKRRCRGFELLVESRQNIPLEGTKILLLQPEDLHPRCYTLFQQLESFLDWEIFRPELKPKIIYLYHSFQQQQNNIVENDKNWFSWGLPEHCFLHCYIELDKDHSFQISFWSTLSWTDPKTHTIKNHVYNFFHKSHHCPLCCPHFARSINAPKSQCTSVKFSRNSCLQH